MPALTAAWRAGTWPWPGHQHLAHDHVVDLVGRDTGTSQRIGDGDATEFGRREACERSGHLADRGAGTSHDH